MRCLFPAVPLSCHVSRTSFSLWYDLQYCNNGISLQIQCLPNVASSFSVSSHDLSPSRRVFFMQCLFLSSLSPVVSLALYSLFGMLYAVSLSCLSSSCCVSCTLLSLMYLTVQLPFYLCLTPDLSPPPATSLSCIVSFWCVSLAVSSYIAVSLMTSQPTEK